MAALRVPFAVGSGGLLSLGLFWVLWTVVNVPLGIDIIDDPIEIKFTPQIIETFPIIKRPQRPEREPPPRIIDPPRIGGNDPTIGGETGVRVDPVPVRPGRPDQSKIIGPDRDTIPFYRPDPVYPPRALTGGIQGWVHVQFSVTETGTVRDAFVVDANPKNMFEDAALKAIAGWRYQPKVEDGVAVERVGLQTVIRFALD